MHRNRVILIFMLVYGVASLTHFAHNAFYLALYPHMPAWLTPAGVWTCWLVIASIGALGYWLLRKDSTTIGLALIALYALLGFGGLDHYTVAPISTHSFAMNVTIVGETLTASALLALILWTAVRGR